MEETLGAGSARSVWGGTVGEGRAGEDGAPPGLARRPHPHPELPCSPQTQLRTFSPAPYSSPSVSSQQLRSQKDKKGGKTAALGSYMSAFVLVLSLLWNKRPKVQFGKSNLRQKVQCLSELKIF